MHVTLPLVNVCKRSVGKYNLGRRFFRFFPIVIKIHFLFTSAKCRQQFQIVESYF